MVKPPFEQIMGQPAQHRQPSAPQMTMDDALREVNEHPAELFQQVGYSVPKECIGNNQATVMHLLRSGQIGGPMMRIIAPLLGRLGVR